MEFFVFNKNLDPIGEISEYITVTTERNFHDVSKMIMRADRNPNTIDLLKIGNIVVNSQDITYGYIIQHVAYLKEREANMIEVYAYSLNWILSRLTVPQQFRYYGPLEQVVKDMIYHNAINPLDSNRRMDNVVLAPNTGGSITVSSSKIGGDLCQNSFDMVRPYNYSFDLLINHSTKKLEVHVWGGTDRSISQNIYPHVIFSQEFDNVLTQEYYESMLDFKNMAYIAGEGEGVNRIITTTGGGTIANGRREIFVDARDIQKTYYDDNGDPQTMSDQDYLGMLVMRGREVLAELRAKRFFESSIEDVQFKLGTDYFLGDFVTFQDKEIGVILNAMVSSIKTEATKDGVTRIPSFTSNVPIN